MKGFEGIINAYQGILPKFKFSEPGSFSEDFAQRRFSKKMEIPNLENSQVRRDQCWSRWIERDLSLPQNVVLPSSEWYKARVILHRILGTMPQKCFYEFPKGSEVFSTSGFNSLESRLCHSRWSVTPEAFGEFSRMVYNHTGLKRALRKRVLRLHNGADVNGRRSFFRKIWEDHKDPSCSYSMFERQMEEVCTTVYGSRFSTVPKNNEKDRPINIEPLGNILVQRSIGVKLRHALSEHGVDLNTLADVHRARISDLRNATVDLSDASDSVSTALCRFLLPDWFFREIDAARSYLVLGLDGNYHQTRKVSSMGNGFTFELMTLVLTSLCKVLDEDSSVFGDDIIIDRRKVPRLIELLSEVGFVVNEEKSFWDGPFRESCGANFHENEGYVESFDFKYPVTIHDCMVIYNKASVLALKYPSFVRLRETLHGFIPSALRGGPNPLEMSKGISKEDRVQADLPFTVADPRPLQSFFMTGLATRGSCSKMREIERKIANRLSYPVSSIQAFIGVRYVPRLRTKTLKHLSPKRHWAKFLAYLNAGLRCKDEISGDGRWVTVVYVSVEGRTSRASAFATD